MDETRTTNADAAQQSFIFVKLRAGTTVFVFCLRASRKTLLKFSNLQPIMMKHFSVKLTNFRKTFMQASRLSKIKNTDIELVLLVEMLLISMTEPLRPKPQIMIVSAISATTSVSLRIYYWTIFNARNTLNTL